MHSIIRQNDKQQYGVMEYIVDEESEVSTLPTTASPGSTCLVIETSTTYMLNNKKQWVKVKFKSGSGNSDDDSSSSSTTSPTLNFVD
jgi:hypothetical protein